jgi:hypothetical protein
MTALKADSGAGADPSSSVFNCYLGEVRPLPLLLSLSLRSLTSRVHFVRSVVA